MSVNNLSIKHIVTSNISLKSRRPTAAGFGTLLIASPVESAGNVDSSNLTKRYFSNAEIALDWGSSTEVYKAANFAFAATPSPSFIKVGFIIDATDFPGSLDAIEAIDDDWIGLAVTAESRDDVSIIQSIGDWCESRVKIFATASNDINSLDHTKQDHVLFAVQSKEYDHSIAIYSSFVDEYPDVALLARQLSVNFNIKNSYQTAKFKRLRLITAEQKITNAQRVTITGFVPPSGAQGGLSRTAGFFGNVYSTIKDISHFAEGTMGSGRFLHNVHFWMWLEDVISTDQYAEYLNDPNIPNTLKGYKQMAGVLKRSLDLGVRAGGITQTVSDDGEFQEAYIIDDPSYTQAPEAMKANGILSALKFCARQTDALHHTVVSGCVHSNS